MPRFVSHCRHQAKETSLFSPQSACENLLVLLFTALLSMQLRVHVFESVCVCVRVCVHTDEAKVFRSDWVISICRVLKPCHRSYCMHTHHRDLVPQAQSKRFLCTGRESVQEWMTDSEDDTVQIQWADGKVFLVHFWVTESPASSCAFFKKIRHHEVQGERQEKPFLSSSF